MEIYYKIKYDPKFHPRRKDAVKISRGDKNRYVLSNIENEETYFIDSSAALIWRLMDGRHSISSIKRRLANKHNPEDVEEFITFAAREKLIEDVETSPSWGNMEKGGRKGAFKPEFVSPLVVNVPILDASKSSAVFKKLYKLTRIFFTRYFLVFAIALVGFTFFLLKDIFMSTLSSQTSFSMQGSSILGFLIFSIVLIFPILIIHELAHGLALTHFGVNPGALGTGLYYFSPMFYCDTSESWRLSRGKRVLVSVVGPLSTLFIGSVAGLLGHFNVFPSITYLFQMTFFFSYYIVLLNMAPMLETDGYYALMDILNIPNLRSEAFGYIKTFLTKGPRAANSKYDEYSRKQRLSMILYGVSSLLWSVIAIYLSYLFFAYIIQDALTQLNNLINSMIVITGMSSPNIEGLLISIGVAIISLGLLTFISVRLYAMTYLPLKTAASRVQRVGGKTLSVDGMYLSASFLAPLLFNSLRTRLLKKLRKCAKRISQDFSIEPQGELVSVRLCLNRGVNKSFAQLRSEAIRYENTLRNNYNSYVRKLMKSMTRDRVASEFYMIDRNNSTKAASLLKRRDFINAFNERIEKVYSNIGQLLKSFICFIWTVDLLPDSFSKLDPKDFEYSFLEDISTSASIYDEGAFRREKVVSGESIESMLKGISEHFGQLKENPRVMQTTHAIALFEPIKNRLMIFGRAKRVGDLGKTTEHLSLTPVRSTLETAALQGLSTSLLRLSQFIERSPTFSAENIRNTEYKDLRYITGILTSFIHALRIIGENIQTLQRLTETVYLKRNEAEREIRALDYDVALLDLVIATGIREPGQLNNNRTLYRSLARQNTRLLGRLEHLQEIVVETIQTKRIVFSRVLRRTFLLSIAALMPSIFLALYLNSVLSGLGAWNLIFAIPIGIILLDTLLSVLRTVRISSKAHSPLIDSLILLSNHCYSLAGEVPSVNKLLNRIT
nr:PqqD family peptide modification chaperone [Candidatus Njordarchaeota archaeon]